MTKRSQPYVEALDERLREPNYAAEYLSAAAEEGREALLLALRDIARARGMGGVAKKAGRGRESLYKALSSRGNPELETFLSVLTALKVKLHFEPA